MERKALLTNQFCLVFKIVSILYRDRKSGQLIAVGLANARPNYKTKTTAVHANHPCQHDWSSCQHHNHNKQQIDSRIILFAHFSNIPQRALVIVIASWHNAVKRGFILWVAIRSREIHTHLDTKKIRNRHEHEVKLEFFSFANIANLLKNEHLTGKPFFMA